MSFDFYKRVIGGTSDTTFNFGRKFVLSGSGGVEPTYKDVILSGVSPLALTKAKANGLNYVKAFGKTEQTNLPSGYTQLKYVQNAATTTKINTGITPQVGDEIEIRFITPYTASTSNYLLQSRESANAGIFGISGSQTGKTIILSWGAGNSVTSSITREYNHVYVVKASIIGTTLSLYVKDVTAGTEDTVTGTITTPSDATTPYFIWGNTSQWLQQITPVYYARITNNGTTRLNYVAAENNDTASFYDLVNNTFITNFSGTITGSEDLAAPTPDTPINIVSNNGVLKVSANILNRNDLEGGYLLTDEGQRGSSNNNWILTNFIKVKPNTSYMFDFVSGGDSVYRRICGYSSNDYNSFTELLVKKQRPVTEGERFSEPFTTSATTNYIKVSTYKSDTNIQITEGTEVIPYHEYGGVYADGTTETITDSKNNSAMAEMLLNVTLTNNYTDVQEILTGVITRNTAIKVLDGTENWIVNTGDYNFYRLNSAVNYSGSLVSGFHCTHFEPVSVASASNNQGIRINSNSLFLRYDNLYPATSENLPLFKQWLADQYANGTPVILVCPLAAPATESVTGQTLSTKSGTNTITATGSLPNLELEVSFKQQQSS